jgi:DNA ligase-1
MDTLAVVAEEVVRHASRLRKITVLADYLRSLSDDDLALAVQFLSGGPVAEGPRNHTLFTVAEKPRLAVGSSVLRDALESATGLDREILNACYAEVGDSGETAGLLMRGSSAEEPLRLCGAQAFYQQLFRARATAEKRSLLAQALRRYRPLTLKYLIKVITRGLRIGVMERQLEEAVAAACGVAPEAIREANNRLGDLAQVALAARRGALSQIEARLFHPMEFMLAKPLERTEDLARIDDWIIEDKYDGIRSQAHFDSGHVRIYSRGMQDVSSAFPELVEAFGRLPGNGLVDGEVLAWRAGRALNFNMLQQRLARKQVRATLQLEVPVAFMAYDLLLRDGRLLLAQPLEARRTALESLMNDAPPKVLLSPQRKAESQDSLEQQFREAQARGNEGLLLKRRGSSYEPGKRSGAWQKLKRPFGTLDVVITAAEQGSGRRAIYFSDYTFAVRSDSGFVNIGKAYSGLTETEIKELSKLLRAASTEKFGRVMLVRPEVVLEVAFDGVQKSARHKGGYALRFPRILRWRRDKAPEECDDLAQVAKLYQNSIQ